ncbi:MAG: DNA polymerase III subunit gamma/tau [Deltaproteobacteria bacterium]|nr:DNA polymerase III subunit gamma/tau [Deltaproteobacteria bacterium]
MSSYQVIARKWRPTVFEQIVGQEHVTRTLKNAVKTGHFAHAYLFCGPRGVGKTTAARILAKCLNCSGEPSSAPCNSCDSCKSIINGSSVDVMEIDGASNNKVEDIRELREAVGYVPSQGKYRVYIIDEVHMVTQQAFNALLKTLEEPPPHVVFIFATTEAHKIPLTIVSRCQRFDFKRIPFKDIQGHLSKIAAQEGIKTDDKALFTLARESDGSLRDAQSLLEQVAAFSGGAVTDADVSSALGLMDRTSLFELVGAVIRADGPSCLNIVEKIYDFGYDLKVASARLIECVRDVTVLKVAGDSSLVDMPDSEAASLAALARDAPLERLQTIFSVLSKGYEEISRSASQRYSFEMALLKSVHLDVQPVDALVARLEELGRSIGARGGTGNADGVKKSASVQMPVQPHAATTSKSAAEAARVVDANAATDDLGAFIRQKNVPWATSLDGSVISRGEASVEISTDAANASFLVLKKDTIEKFASDCFGKKMSVTITTKEAPLGVVRDDKTVKDAVRILKGRVIEDRRRG